MAGNSRTLVKHEEAVAALSRIESSKDPSTERTKKKVERLRRTRIIADLEGDTNGLRRAGKRLFITALRQLKGKKTRPTL